MKRPILSTQAWQVEATESMWSIMRRFIALDRPTIEQCVITAGHRFSSWQGQWQWMLYRPSAGIESYETLRQALKLSKRQMRTATLAILPMTHGGGRAVRFCQLCLEQGFHSSLFQIPWIEHCPIHGQLLQHTCPVCHCPVEAIWDARFIRDPFTCRECIAELGKPLGTAIWPLQRSERMRLYRLHRQYDITYENLKGYAYPREQSLWSHWDLMKLFLSTQQHETLLSTGVPLEKVYGSQGREGPKPIRGLEFFEDAEKTRNRFQESAMLIATWKSFRRHLERGIPRECAEFCVNGSLAGNCRNLTWKHDVYEEARCTQGITR